MKKRDIELLGVREKAMKMAQEQYPDKDPDYIVKAAKVFEGYLSGESQQQAPEKPHRSVSEQLGD